MYVDCNAGFIREVLKFSFPETHARAIRAATVRGDCQFLRPQIAHSSHAFAPAADGLHGELGCVARDPNADKASIGGHIIYAIGSDLAEFLVFKVVRVYPTWITFRAIVGSAILVVADQLFLLRVDGDNGLVLSLRFSDLCVDIFELSVSIGVFRAFIRLAIELACVSDTNQLLIYGIGTDRVSHFGQSRCKLIRAFRNPKQRPHGVAQGRRVDQTLERGDKAWILVTDCTTPAAGATNRPFRQRPRIEIILAAIDR